VLGVPADALVATVERWNADARRGVDTEFGRGSDIYQRHLGDADHRPNPCVAPIEEGPFYAVAVQPADLGMAAGIVTDDRARVLATGGVPIPGLYACGNDMQSVMNGAYPGPGITLGPALVFGYVAARHAAQA
jgi:predicted oxidoreductase